MSFDYDYPSFNNDGVFCVSSSGQCRFSGHPFAVNNFCFHQSPNAGSIPYYSCSSLSSIIGFGLGVWLAVLLFPLSLLCFKFAKKRKR